MTSGLTWLDESMEKHCDGLREFFQSTWGLDDEGDRYRYRVYLACKAQNLNEIYYAKELSRLRRIDLGRARKLRMCRRRTFLSQTGIILKAPELTEYYFEHRSFPPILVVDELAVTGHDISELVYTLDDVIETIWIRRYQEEYSEKDLQRLRARLFASIDYRTFLVDSRGLLVENTVGDRVSPPDGAEDGREQAERPQLVTSGEWFPYIQTVCQFITQREGVENTAFTPTFYMGVKEYDRMCESLLDSGEWHMSRISERIQGDEPEKAGTVEILQRDITDAADDIQAHMALYCRQREGAQRVAVTPYVLFGVIYNSAIRNIFHCIQHYLSGKKNISVLADILARPYSQLISPRLQLVSTILSILLMGDCWRQAGFSQEEIRKFKKVDLGKISQAYGTINEVFPALACLLKERDYLKELFSDVLEIIVDDSEGMGDSFCADTPESRIALLPDSYVFEAKDYFKRAVFRKYRSQAVRRRDRIVYSAWSEFVNEDDGLSKYLDAFSSRFDNFDHKIAALLFLIHQGYVGQSIHNGEEDACFLNAGEASLALEFMPMSRYMPALTSLERMCDKNGLNIVRWATNFGGFLDDTNQGINLEEQFHNFVNRIYLCGFSLRDWPFTKAMGEKLQPEPKRYSMALKEFLT